MLPSADLHVGDSDLGEILPMTGVAAITGATGKAENPDLLVLAVTHDLGGHGRSLEQRRAGLNLLAVARCEHAIERHLIARPGREERDFDRDSRLRAELATARRENRVAHRARNLNRDLGLVKRPRTARLHRGQQGAPSFGIHRVSSSGRPAPRARDPSASRAAAGNSAPARPGIAPPPDATARRAAAPCDRRRRASGSAPCDARPLRGGIPGPSRCTWGTRSSSIARATGVRAGASSRRSEEHTSELQSPMYLV